MSIELNINLMKQSGDTLFAVADKAVELRKQGNQQKVLGSGYLGSLTEFDKELFNAAKSAFKGEDVVFNVNGNEYAKIGKDDNWIELSDKFPSSEIEKYSNTNRLELKVEKTQIGMFKLKAPEGFNLYQLEQENYIRDRNGYTEHATREDALAALDFYFKEDPKQNTYTIQKRDLTKVFIDNELINEFRDRKSLIFPDLNSSVTNELKEDKKNGLKFK